MGHPYFFHCLNLTGGDDDSLHGNGLSYLAFLYPFNCSRESTKKSAHLLPGEQEVGQIK
jgi:hypothetical protein